MSKEDSTNRERPDRSKKGVKPTQALLFDGPIQKDSNIRPKESAPQHTEMSGGEPEEIHTAGPKQEEPAQIEPHIPSERAKKFIEKYKKDRKAGKVKPLITKSQQKPSEPDISEPEEMIATEDTEVNFTEDCSESGINKFILSTKALNWFIGGYIAFYIFGRPTTLSMNPSLGFIFILIPFLLLFWQVLIIRQQFLQEKAEYSYSNFYECVEEADWFRIFWLVLVLHWPLASKHVIGFYSFSGIAIILVALLTYTAIAEYVKHRSITTLLVGCVLFLVLLLYCVKSVYVVHYGVPIVGHFFEKPEYDAKYYVDVEPENSGRKYKVIADIHVEGRTESEDVGEGYYGQPISHIFECRDVWIKKLYFQNEGSVVIKGQDEPLHLDESVFVEDTHGKTWYITLLDEPTR